MSAFGGKADMVPGETGGTLRLRAPPPSRRWSCRGFRLC